MVLFVLAHVMSVLISATQILQRIIISSQNITKFIYIYIYIYKLGKGA